MKELSEPESAYTNKDRLEVRVTDMLDELASVILDAGGLIPPHELRFYGVEQLFNVLARNGIKAHFYAAKPYAINLRLKSEESDKK